MKIEKGMAVNVEGMSDIVRQAVVKKFEVLGFEFYDSTGSFIGIDGFDGDITGYSSVDNFSEGKDIKGIEITLSDLMFCDQPDEITHCYYCRDEGMLLYHYKETEWMGDVIHICTREAKPVEDCSTSWHEHHTREITRLTEFMVNNGIGNPGENCIDVAIKELSEKHNIQSERDKLIDKTFDAIKKHEESHSYANVGDAMLGLAIYLVDAGWRPSND